MLLLQYSGKWKYLPSTKNQKTGSDDARGACPPVRNLLSV